MGTGVLAPVAFLGSTAVAGDMECIDHIHYHWECEEFFKSFDTNAYVFCVFFLFSYLYYFELLL